MEYLPIAMLVMLMPMTIGFVVVAEMMMAKENDELNELNGWNE